MARTTRTRRFAIALVSAALVATGLGVVGVAGATSATASSSMLGQVNAERAKHGERALAWNAHLASVAQEQANRMARKRELYHNPNLAGDVGNYRWVGENVGYGPTSAVIQDAFMDSPGHRANILDGDFTQIGIAERRDGKGRLWVAQVFRKPLNGGSSSGNASAPTKKKARPAKATTSKPKKRSSAAGRTPAATTTPRAQATPSRAAARPTTPTKPSAAPVAKKPRAATTAAAPAPTPTLAQRVAYVQQAAASTDAPTDPVGSTLSFAAAMHAVAGA